MAAERAILNITLCPKFNEARLRWVFKAASSYPRRWENYKHSRELKINALHLAVLILNLIHISLDYR